MYSNPYHYFTIHTCSLHDDPSLMAIKQLTFLKKYQLALVIDGWKICFALVIYSFLFVNHDFITLLLPTHVNALIMNMIGEEPLGSALNIKKKPTKKVPCLLATFENEYDGMEPCTMGENVSQLLVTLPKIIIAPNWTCQPYHVCVRSLLSQHLDVTVRRVVIKQRKVI